MTIVLPTSAALGDIVRITGLGAGGWQVDTGPLDTVQSQAQHFIELRCVTHVNRRILSCF